MTGLTAGDGELTRAAQAGDIAALGLLLDRHRASLHAHALRVVGVAHAQDVVQDTFVLALRKIGHVRQPDAVAAWLHSAVHSLCLSRLRRDHAELPLDELAPPAAPAREAPEAAIDRLAMRDWVWTAIAELSEPLRVVAMLRYFGSYDSYEEIAAICGVPVGTVRSRLSQVKLKLADAMLATAQAAHGDAAARSAERERRLSDSVHHMNRTGDYSRFIEPLTPNVETVFRNGLRLKGRHLVEAVAAEDAEAGVVFLPTHIVPGPGITIVEARFINPPDNPALCPTTMAQIHYHHSDDTTFRIALHYAA